MGVNGIYGLSGSGLDIESMVKAGMLTMQNRYDKMYKKETKQAWEKEIYADMYSSLTTFKFTTLSSYKMKSTLNANTAKSSDEKYVTAKANGDAITMSHKVTVNSLGSNAYLMTGDKGMTRAKSEVTQINDDGTTKQIKNTGIKLQDAVFYDIQQVKTDDKITYKYQLKEGGDWYEADGDDTAISFAINDSSTALTETQKKANTIEYSFNDLYEGKTYNDLAADINKKGTNIVASYDATTDSFSMYNSKSGPDATIGLTLTSGIADTTSANGSKDTYGYAATLFNNLNLYQSTNGTLSTSQITYTADDKETAVKGSNASVTIDGKKYDNVEDNKVTVAGVTYSLLDTTKTGETITVSVSQDTDSIIDTVKKFVEDYNKVLDDLNTKYRTTTWDNDTKSDYEPLSKTEQKDMTDDEIEKWNNKVKSGLLYHSKIVGNLITAMRTAVSTPVKSVNSSYNSASSIGITSSDTKGHLTLDEDKLKKALAADSDCVYQIFANDQDTYTDEKDLNKRYQYMADDDYNNRGIINRLYYNALTDGLSNIKDYAGIDSDTDDQSSLGKTITSLLNKMEDFKDQMSAYETLLYKKYDSLESYVSQMNSVYSSIFGASS